MASAKPGKKAASKAVGESLPDADKRKATAKQAAATKKKNKAAQELAEHEEAEIVLCMSLNEDPFYTYTNISVSPAQSIQITHQQGETYVEPLSHLAWRRSLHALTKSVWNKADGPKKQSSRDTAEISESAGKKTRRKTKKSGMSILRHRLGWRK